MGKKKMVKGAGLLARLDKGPVICAEGYLFELGRRGSAGRRLRAGGRALEHPGSWEEAARSVHAGSDVVEAFTY